MFRQLKQLQSFRRFQSADPSQRNQVLKELQNTPSPKVVDLQSLGPRTQTMTFRMMTTQPKTSHPSRWRVPFRAKFRGGMTVHASHLAYVAFLLLFCGGVTRLAAEQPTSAAAEAMVPDEALADDVSMVMCGDLKPIDLHGLCTTISRDLGSKADLALPYARTRQAASENCSRQA